MWSKLHQQLDRLPRWLVHGFWIAVCASWAAVDYRRGNTLWFGFWCAFGAGELVSWLDEVERKFWRGMSLKWRALYESERAISDQQHNSLVAALPLMETAARIVAEQETKVG